MTDKISSDSFKVNMPTDVEGNGSLKTRLSGLGSGLMQAALGVAITGTSLIVVANRTYDIMAGNRKFEGGLGDQVGITFMGLALFKGVTIFNKGSSTIFKNFTTQNSE